MNLMFLRAQWDRVTAVCAFIVGVVVLIIGYHGVADDPFAAGQIPYVISAGVGGIFFLGVAGTLWLSADLKDEWRKLDELLEALRLRQSDTASPVLDQLSLPRPPESADAVATSGGSAPADVLEGPAAAVSRSRPSRRKIA